MITLHRINLLGHSFGGYLSSQYSLKYPDRVEKLILADPWGMMPRFGLLKVDYVIMCFHRPEDLIERWNISFGFRVIFSIVKVNPIHTQF